MLHAVVAPTIEEADGRPTLVFAVTKEHARRLAEVFNRYPGVTAEYVVAETDRDDRSVAVRDFQSGRLQVLVGVGCFLEGFDAPACAVVCMARPTLSELIYTQAIGRGTRPLPGIVDGLDMAEARRDAIGASDKPWVTVLDFVGNSGRHRLVSAVDVLGGEAAPEDIAAAAEDLREHGDAEEVQAVIDRAIHNRELREMREAERREQAQARRARLRATAQYRAREVDPFGSSGTPDYAEPAYRGGASEKQIGYLARLGVGHETASGYTKRQASVVIDKILKQTGAKFVMRFGKHQGRTLGDIDPEYLRWAADNIASAELRENITEALDDS
jgi:superfamily II DNA or RNA helicase